MFKSLATVLCAIAAASARITSIAPLESTFQASNASTLTVTFNTENGQNPVFDWFAAIGVMPAAGRADPTALGTFVANVDFVAIGQSLTPTGNFSVDIPVNTTKAITRGDAQYVLTAAIMSSAGVEEFTVANFLNVTFSAATA
ncbi:hypothetical protein EXIGLDRAFT_721762 [Exidia glandulosa HHB12029]|uniref:Uncharacterized protein n=1 Tax=Exidia glandulosa HHB12029 TaxID=1314781 RepID=A0A165QFY9_EXIGL|nr:hypothetical protein EXIGLDRAFT_721762 [Exidia glandulosa HHB12029]